jgi:hypothetical protein
VTSTNTARYAAGLAAAAALLAVSGCSGQGSVEDGLAAATAERFAQEVTSDPEAACALLAPRTRMDLEETRGPCAQSLPQQDLPEGGRSREAEVYGKDAVVHLEKDTLFLARFDTGWRVTAAGCTPAGDQPYDCDVKGG